jgi:uncharacterized protein YndB with AHSA1/START domain
MRISVEEMVRPADRMVEEAWTEPEVTPRWWVHDRSNPTIENPTPARIAE